ncbi:MAG: helix-turn-helix domain-containing protein [Anaerolineae bacterium]|nr:helix-turn-helix domain-containing protein [Anaerolineae bacterium]
MLTYVPGAPLSDYIQMFWAWEGYHPPHPRERILPNGVMEITIDLNGNSFEIFDESNQQKSIRGPMVVGAQSKYFVNNTSSEMSLLSVWFKPGGVKQFLGVGGNDIHNQHIPLEILWGQSANELYCQLLEVQTAYQRFCILEQMLLKRLQHVHERHRAVSYALHLFRQIPQTQTIRSVTNTIALSHTRFIQAFREEVGMTPKLFCRLQRFRHALGMLAEPAPPDSLEVALACGYYDQSHFINDFQAFAGMSPSSYRPQSREHNTNLPESG